MISEFWGIKIGHGNYRVNQYLISLYLAQMWCTERV